MNAAQRAAALPLEVAVRAAAAADSVAVLLELRANPNPVTRREGSLRHVGLLAQCLTSLMAEEVRSTILAALLATGANPDTPGHDAVLPLYSVSNTAAAARLLAAGASVNAPPGSVLPPPAKWHRDLGRSDEATWTLRPASTDAGLWRQVHPCDNATPFEGAWPC